MLVMVLIRAGEGDTQDVYIARGRNELRQRITDIVEEDDMWFCEGEKDSLFAMLDKHENWGVGRYILKNIEPHWEQWTLIIEDV
jgi:hypothetical protein